MDSNRMVQALDALRDIVTESENTTVKPASLEETQNFKPLVAIQVGEKLRYKGGAPLKFPKKGEEVYVYNKALPDLKPGCESEQIRRNDFSFLVVYSDGDTCEFAADSRYFERVQ